MGEQSMRTLISEVEAGRLSRRRFTQVLVGLTAPTAAHMLGSAGRAHAQPTAPRSPCTVPTRRFNTPI